MATSEVLAARREQPARRVHHRHRILDRDRLRTASLEVDLAAREARQDQSLFAVNEMPAVELGGHSDGEAQLAHRSLDHRFVGYRGDEIAAHPDEYLHPIIEHGLNGVDDVVTVGAGWIEAERTAEPIEEFRLRLLVDPDRPVSLDVRVPSHRTYASAGPTDIATQK